MANGNDKIIYRTDVKKFVLVAWVPLVVFFAIFLRKIFHYSGDMQKIMENSVIFKNIYLIEFCVFVWISYIVYLSVSIIKSKGNYLYVKDNYVYLRDKKVCEVEQFLKYKKYYGGILNNILYIETGRKKVMIPMILAKHWNGDSIIQIDQNISGK